MSNDEKVLHDHVIISGKKAWSSGCSKNIGKRSTLIHNDKNRGEMEEIEEKEIRKRVFRAGSLFLRKNRIFS